MRKYIIVDCEAPHGIGSPSVGDMTEFGAVELDTRISFHGRDCSKETFNKFYKWLNGFRAERLVFVSDNPAYDFQWINFYFYKYFNMNPFGHSARRIGDFAAGLSRNFQDESRWKRLRITKHDHNPVHDAMGNVEALTALIEISKEERG